MTPEDVRAAAKRLAEFHHRFAPLFGKDEAQDHAYTYVKGLMVLPPPEHKSVEPIALHLGAGRVSALQKFLTSAPWDHEDVPIEVQEVFTEKSHFLPMAMYSPPRRPNRKQSRGRLAGTIHARWLAR